MAEAKCPACRGELGGAAFAQHCGCETIVAKCGACGWRSPWDEVGHGGENYDAAEAFVLDQCAPLAYFDPRPDLPTVEEDAAHRARHGEGAGFMYRIVPGVLYFTSLGRYPKLNTDRGRRDIEVYAHVNGRPVAWPEVKP